MIVRQLYTWAAGMPSAAVEGIRFSMGRLLLGIDAEHTLREDEALATLRALGDDGSRLEQAVALAVAGATDEQVDAFVRGVLRGEDHR